MKEKELREHATCTYCGKLIGESGFPGFFVVTVEGYSLNLEAISRQQGLGMALTADLAMVMGPDEDLARLATHMVTHTTTTMCWTCFAEKMPEPEAPSP